MHPVVLSIAGSDNSAGAGAQADLKTLSALGVYGLTAITCIVAEIPGKVSAIQAVEPRITRDVYRVLTVEASVAARKSFGGTAPANVARAVKDARKRFL